MSLIIYPIIDEKYHVTTYKFKTNLPYLLFEGGPLISNGYNFEK